MPPRSTTYIFPTATDNLQVRVWSEGKRVDAYTTIVDASRSPIVAVHPRTAGLKQYTIEVRQLFDDEVLLLGEVTYRVDDKLTHPDPVGAEVLDRTLRVKSDGVPRCASYDHLYLWVSARSFAYRVEWARSEQAYRDGDRHVAVVRRAGKLVGNAIRLGESGCGQDVISPGREKTIFVGVAPLGLESDFDFRLPAKPTRIHVADVEILPSDLPRKMFRPPERPKETPPMALWRWLVALGVGAGLGWPVGVMLGRAIAARRARDTDTLE